MNKIRVAVVGTGFGAKVHLPGYLLNDKYDVRGICAHTPGKGQAVAEQYGIYPYGSIDEIAGDGEIDLVSIAAIPKEHFEFAAKAIRAGKAVILEKPMAICTGESKELLDLAKENNSKAALVHEHRFDPSKQYLKKIIETGEYGETRSIEILKHMTYWNTPDSERLYDWFADREAGGGMTGAHLSHQLDFLHFIGNGPLRQIQGFGFTEVRNRYDAKAGKYKKHTSDDSVYALAVTATGIPAAINISASKFIKIDHVRIFTDKGELRITGQDSIEFYSITGQREEMVIPAEFLIKNYQSDFRINSFVCLIDAFYSYYYQNGEKRITTFHDGYEIQRELEQIKYEEREV